MVNDNALVNCFIDTFNVKDALNMYNLNSDISVSETTFRRHLKKQIKALYGVDYTEWTQKNNKKAKSITKQVDRLKMGFAPNRNSQNRRTNFSKGTREWLLAKANNSCACCGRKLESGMWDIDHIDGNHSNGVLSNLQILCKNCHGKKTLRQIRSGLYKKVK